MDFDKLKSALKNATAELDKAKEQFYKEVGHEVFEVVNAAKLRWTKKTPTVPGVYWLKAHLVSIVEVCLDCNRKLIVLFPGSDEYTPLGLLKKCEWCGPITQPQDAE